MCATKLGGKYMKNESWKRMFSHLLTRVNKMTLLSNWTSNMVNGNPGRAGRLQMRMWYERVASGAYRCPVMWKHPTDTTCEATGGTARGRGKLSWHAGAVNAFIVFHLFFSFFTFWKIEEKCMKTLMKLDCLTLSILLPYETFQCQYLYF